MSKSKSLLSSLALTTFSVSCMVPSVDAAYKCFGIAEKGENDCGAIDHDEHTCGGVSTRSKHKGDWKVVESEEACKKAGGLSEAEAREALGLPPA